MGGLEGPWIYDLKKIKGLTLTIKMIEENSQLVDNRKITKAESKEKTIMEKKRNERQQLQMTMCTQLPEIMKMERCKGVVRQIGRVCANLLRKLGN